MLDKTFQSAEIEKKHYSQWEGSGIFTANARSNKQPYTIPMPPPNVTGSLHMGHALNMTLQDILTRYQRMRGRDVLWQPGTDHAGIATQMVVERQLAEKGQSRHQLGREAFIDKVWEWKAISGNTITGQLRRLGATPDWTRERFTMDEGLNRAVRKVFVQLYKEHLIYKDKRLVNWDPKLHTAISDLEVEQRETKSSMWYFRYPVEGQEGRFIVIATTRPETMLGDVAVAVHPADERYQDLIGKNAVLPIVGRKIQIVADEYADPEKGTGAVKITPAHDFNDFEVGRRHKLAMIDIFDRDAKLNENAPAEYRGLDRYEARKKVLAEMEALELIEKIEPHTYMLPYGDRSGVVIEPMLTDQWYCDAKTLAGPAIRAVEEGKTEFVPKTWEKTYFEWMNNIQPWCISRQLWWGHQIPAWYAPDNTVFVEETEEEAKAAAKKCFGRDVELVRDPDVLDTWFSSALWPFSTLGWPDNTDEVRRYYPSDTLITGFDIIFFWVARMMMMGIHFMKDVPFRKVYIHALVRDEKGQKMSKSKGNIIDPLELIDKYGTDALRFTLTAMAAQGRDIRLSEQRVEGYRNFTTKLWNAARYCEMNECRPMSDFRPGALTQTVNRWIVGELFETSRRVAKALDQYRFNEAANAVYQFAWGTFCDWYIEFTKPLLLGQDEMIKAETRVTTGWVMDQLLLLLNPVMPFLTEELHAHLSGKDGSNKDDWFLTAHWPEYDGRVSDPKAMAEMAWVVRLITAVRSVRSDLNVPVAAKINLLIKGASDLTRHRAAAHGDIIRRLARLESVDFTDKAPKGAVQAVLDEATIILPVADVINVDQERQRLRKEIERLSSDIQKIQQKLANESFVAKAPPEIVDEQKERMVEAENVKTKLAQALMHLDAA